MTGFEHLVVPLIQGSVFYCRPPAFLGSQLRALEMQGLQVQRWVGVDVPAVCMKLFRANPKP